MTDYLLRLQPRQNLLNAASRVGEASTTVLHTIGEETEEDKETQVTNDIYDNRIKCCKKSFLYRKLNYCYDNFYSVFFGKNREFGDEFGEDDDDMTIGDRLAKTDFGDIRFEKSDDEGIFGEVNFERKNNGGYENVRDLKGAENNHYECFDTRVLAKGNENDYEILKTDGNYMATTNIDAKVKNHDDEEGIYEEIDTSRRYGLDVIQEESDSDYYRSLDYCNALFKPGKPITIQDLNYIRTSKTNLNDKNNDYDSIIEMCEGYLDSNSLDKSNSDISSDYKSILDFNFDKHSDAKSTHNDITKVIVDDVVNVDKSHDSIDKGGSTEKVILTTIKNNDNINNIEEKPKIYPKTVSDKIFNFKKDFSNHDYVNINYNKSHNSNINLDRRMKNDLLRQRFFLSTNNIEKNEFNDRFNKYNKKIECHSIVNDITKTGPDVKVSGSLNLKILNPEKYNRVLTTKETFMETANASFTKNEISRLRNDNFENFVKRSERYYTTECKDREVDVKLNNERKGKTEIRIFYNPTFKVTDKANTKVVCQYCKRKCPKTEIKCCEKCVCFEQELLIIWKENWLNILLLIALLLVLVALVIQWVIPNDVCDDEKERDGKCFEMM